MSLDTVASLPNSLFCQEFALASGKAASLEVAGFPLDWTELGEP